MFRRSLAALVVLPMMAVTTQAQFVVSTRAGLVHHLDGEVLVEDQELSRDGPPFGWVGIGEVLRTGEDGRCEVILTPGSVLRVGRQSSIRLLSDDITNIRLELLSGSAIIDWSSGSEARPIRLAHGDSRIDLHKRGQYRFNVYSENGAQLHVIQGQAELAHDGAPVAAGNGQAITLTTGGVEGFDPSETDSFDDWNKERSEYIARVNNLTRSRNQRIVDGLRELFRRPGSGGSRSVRRPFHKTP